jgi:hypothetical protein
MRAEIERLEAERKNRWHEVGEELQKEFDRAADKDRQP